MGYPRIITTDRRRMPRPSSPLNALSGSLPQRAPISATVAIAPITHRAPAASRCHRRKASATRKATIQSLGTKPATGRNTRPALTAAWDASAGAMKVTRWKSLSPNLARRSSVPIWN
jgi:hypothetical protein